MLYEPFLRVMSRQLRRKPSVPMLIDSGIVVRDSLDIALYAERHGSGTPLFPKGQEGEIYGWNDGAERLLEAARSRLMERLVADDGALYEAVPSPLSKLGPSLVPLARMGATFIIRKYKTRTTPAAQTEATIASVMERADAAVSRNDYLVGGQFTFADLAVAAALGMIAPHPRQPLGPASRKVWSEPTIAAAFPNLLSWRDRIIEHHR